MSVSLLVRWDGGRTGGLGGKAVEQLEQRKYLRNEALSSQTTSCGYRAEEGVEVAQHDKEKGKKKIERQNEMNDAKEREGK